MARLPYADPDAPGVQALVQRITRERGSVLHLYQMLLHSPALAEGWLALLTAVRQRSCLSGALRELIIMRVAHLNGASYEADQHAPIALREGVSQRQLDVLQEWAGHTDCFDARQSSVLALTDAMTRDVAVSDEAWRQSAQHHSPQEMVEICVTISAYNMVSRFLEVIQIHSTDPRPAGPGEGQ